MKLPNKINPVHCASNDASRYVLNSVSLQGDLAVSTNGRCLFAVKGFREDGDYPRDALIPKRVAAAAWPKKRGVVLPALTINPVEEGEHATCTVWNADMDKTDVKEIEGTFPNIEHVIPDVEAYTRRVGLNVKFLLQLAKCFGEDEITIHFDSEGDGMQEKPMVITSKRPEAFGILMPCRTTGSVLKNNEALSDITSRIEKREAAEQAERDASIARAREKVEAERAAAAAKAEADREKTAAWMASNLTAPNQ